MILAMFFQPFVISSVFFTALFVDNVKGNTCEVKVEKVGCFNDETRPLEKLLIYRRATYSHKEQDVKLPRLLCDCAIEAQLRGYSYIGLQYYAECWSSSKIEPRYDRDGPNTNNCLNAEYQRCSQDDEECVGGKLTNFVYKIVNSDVSTPEINEIPATTEPANNEETSHGTTQGATEQPSIPSEPMAQMTEQPSIPSETMTQMTQEPSMPSEPMTQMTEEQSIPSEPMTQMTEEPSIPSETMTQMTEEPSMPSEPMTQMTEEPSIPSKLMNQMTKEPSIPLPPYNKSPTSQVGETPSMLVPSTSTKPPCRDNRRNCAMFQDYCTGEYPTMLEECPKTCNLCE